MKSVLVLNHFAVGLSGAGGTRHVELFGRLDDWDTTILAARVASNTQTVVLEEASIKTVPVLRGEGNGPKRVLNWLSYTATSLAAGVRYPKPTVVYGSSPHMGAAMAGYLLAKRHGAGFVLEIRDLWPLILVETGMLEETSPLYRSLKSVERFLYRKADAVIVLAEGSATDVIADGADAEHVHFIPNGAEPADFEVDEDREALRADLGIEGFAAIYAGAHGPANGLEFVLDAAEELADTIPELRIYLVGDGSTKPGLVEEAERRSITNVVFHDPVPKSEIPRLFAAADVGLHCLADVEMFHRGVSPNKIYDYMAAGLPVVTNTPGEVAELVATADSGFAVAPKQLADGLRQVHAATSAEREAFGDNGRDYMNKNRSRTAMSAVLGKVLDDVAARHR